MEKFQVCICVVEKMNGSDHVRFEDVLLKFDEYADAMKYAEKMKKNSARTEETDKGLFYHRAEISPQKNC